MESTATVTSPEQETWITPLYVYQQGVPVRPPILAIMRGSYENPEIVVEDLFALPNVGRFIALKKGWKVEQKGIYKIYV